MNATAAPTAEELLALWERAAAHAAAPLERDDALLHALPDAPPRSLGARHAALLGLRARLFGQVQPLRCHCPHCGEASEFSIDCDALAQALLPATDALQPQLLEAHGWHIEFRLPDAADLRAASGLATDDDGFVQVLMQRCISHCAHDNGATCPPQELPAPVAEALSQRMEALEPGANVTFELDCPACTQTWHASMDVGGVLWSELQTRAERLLLDVDALARAYGWSETEVLALSPVRRAAYLQLAGAA